MSGTWDRVARPERFELPTLWFEARCSIQLSYGRVPPSYQNSRVARRDAGCGVQQSGAGVRTARIRMKGCGGQSYVCRADKRRRSSERNRERLVGLGRLELPTSPLSGVRSSHLSYRPNLLAGNILRDLPHSSNNGAGCVSLDYEEGLSGTGAIARKSSRKRSA